MLAVCVHGCRGVERVWCVLVSVMGGGVFIEHACRIINIYDVHVYIANL